jgi:hypothetical protein
MVVSVAVVDSGVNVPHPHLPGVRDGIAIDFEGNVSESYVDQLGHGTAAAAAIHEKAPDAELRVIKVFDTELATTVSTLVRAIDWASERRCRLVNLSLGTPNEFREAELTPAIERAVDRGTIVVSAFEQDGMRWYPGCIPGALGVVMDAAHPRESVRARWIDGHPVLEASPYPRPIPGVPPERNLNGISFAVANATGVLARLLGEAREVRTATEALDLVTKQSARRASTPPGE